MLLYFCCSSQRGVCPFHCQQTLDQRTWQNDSQLLIYLLRIDCLSWHLIVSPVIILYLPSLRTNTPRTSNGALDVLTFCCLFFLVFHLIPNAAWFVMFVYLQAACICTQVFFCPCLFLLGTIFVFHWIFCWTSWKWRKNLLLLPKIFINPCSQRCLQRLYVVLKRNSPQSNVSATTDVSQGLVTRPLCLF